VVRGGVDRGGLVKAFGRRGVYAALGAVCLVAFFLLLLYPLGLQAVLVGGVRDVDVSPAELKLYASNVSVFCYRDVLELKNLGSAGLAYSLDFSLEGRAEFFEVRSSNDTLFAAPVRAAKRLVLEPGAAVKLSVCLKGPSDSLLRLRFWDSRFREATESVVTVSVSFTDWWNNTFSRRIELTPVVSREGVALFEVTGEGEVYVNGKYVRRIWSLAGVPAGSVAVVYRVGGADYLVPSQVEAWVERNDGVLEPRGVRAPNEVVGRNDRLVFTVYLANESRIFLYFGGGPLGQFKPAIEVSGNRAAAGSFYIELNDYGFSGPGFSANLSGSIVYPYTARRETYSDPGEWKLVLSGPVRALFAFVTNGLSRYRVESFLAVWGRGAEAALVYVWPSVERRGTILEWIGAVVSSPNATFQFLCGTTCDALPVKLEQTDEEAKLVLCRDYWQPGNARFGYYALLFSKLELAELKTLSARLSSFPGG
jgi:hypothetical protein